jgi:hypothetical protein
MNVLAGSAVGVTVTTTTEVRGSCGAASDVAGSNGFQTFELGLKRALRAIWARLGRCGRSNILVKLVVFSWGNVFRYIFPAWRRRRCE